MKKIPFKIIDEKNIQSIVHKDKLYITDRYILVDNDYVKHNYKLSTIKPEPDKLEKILKVESGKKPLIDLLAGLIDGVRYERTINGYELIEVDGSFFQLKYIQAIYDFDDNLKYSVKDKMFKVYNNNSPIYVVMGINN